MIAKASLGSCLALALALPASGAGQAERFRLQEGDCVVFLGNALVEYDQFHGYLELRLLRHTGQAHVTFRNLGWSGDTVRGDARSSGYQNPEGRGRLLKEVRDLRPTVLFVGYGMNESFAGPAGLPAFVQGFGKLLDDLGPLHARVVVLSPSWHEDLGRPLPDPTGHNRDLEAYVAALEKLARQRGLAFVDLFHPLARAKQAKPGRPLTSNGILLNAYGYWLAAAEVERQLGFDPASWHVELAATGKELALSEAAIAEIKAGPGGLRFRLTPATLPAPPRPGPADAGDGPVLRVAGLAAGRYTLTIDGHEVLAAPADAWNQGVRITTGPIIEEVEKLRAAIVERNDLYYRRWRPFNDHSRHWGYMAGDFKRYDDLVARQEQVIEQCRHPRPHVFEVAAKGESR